MLYRRDGEATMRAEQVSVVLGKDFVISFQEMEDDVSGPVRERIRTSTGRIRKMGAGYLAYALIDAIVDNYFAILEEFGERIEEMQNALIDNPTTKTLEGIHALKREMVLLRKSIWPLRDVVSGLQRLGSDLIGEQTILYLRDAHDHAIRVADTVETYRDMLSGMIDLYLSSMSNRMNEVMKFVGADL